MSVRRRGSFNPFGLAFLDAMMCGFGAVVLLYMVINASVGVRAGRLTGELQGEVDRLEREVLEGVRNLVELRNAVVETDRQRETARGLSRRLLEVLREIELELANLDETTVAEREHLNRLKTDVRTLEEEARRLAGRVTEPETPGDRLRSFVGDGDRQYLTGLKVGGRRIFLLLDASSSMLGETIVNVVRRRNLPDERKVQAAKWRRAVATVDWLTTRIPPESRFQIYTFAERAAPALAGTEGEWLDGGDPKRLEEAVVAVRQVVPDGGTNLYRAFEAAAAMRPPPDSITLVTDGLPTQGGARAAGATVSARQRLRLFDRAVGALPSRVPVNTLLLPIEGDPMAASAFWKLAMATGGSFLTPSEDWP
ncbi:MAG: VWA domain-containing protein [Thermoanaerobaculia bacterium]|nr:VWA domain-containing protein [Thermoanaerobaculia bacterium]